MSKMDALRAMREARFEQAQARGGQTAPARPVRTPTRTPTRSAAAPPEVDAAETLCGHRAISGRTCTREAGHAAKSHRYA
jgi:hypothetical protein